MKILNVEIYRDGGTQEVKTDQGIFFIDNPGYRGVLGAIYDGWPTNGAIRTPDMELILPSLVKAWNEGYTACRNNGFKSESEVKRFLTEQFGYNSPYHSKYEEYLQSTNKS